MDRSLDVFENGITYYFSCVRILEFYKNLDYNMKISSWASRSKRFKEIICEWRAKSFIILTNLLDYFKFSKRLKISQILKWEQNDEFLKNLLISFVPIWKIRKNLKNFLEYFKNLKNCLCNSLFSIFFIFRNSLSCFIPFLVFFFHHNFLSRKLSNLHIELCSSS